MHITYDTLSFKLTGTLQACDSCARSKEKARALIKKTYTRASKPGEIIFVDTTGTFLENLIVKCYWIEVVDKYSHYPCSFFRKTKSQLPKKMEQYFAKMKLHVTPFNYLCCDNAGENQTKFQKVYEK